MNKDLANTVIDYIGKALTVIAYIIGGGAIIKYRASIFDTYPSVGWVLGLFVVLTGLYFYWLLIKGAAEDIEAKHSSKRVGVIYSSFLMFVAFIFLLAALNVSSSTS